MNLEKKLELKKHANNARKGIIEGVFNAKAVTRAVRFQLLIR